MKIIFSVFLGLMLGGCFYSSTNSTALNPSGKQLMLISAEEMQSGANEAYAKVIAEADAKNTLNTDAKTTERVRKISQDLIAQTGVFRQDALGWAWEINVINDKTINAWCMPGGKIVVYTGIIEALSLSDAELAAILGHEISHALREHSRQAASMELAKSMAIGLGASILGLDNTVVGLANLATQFTITLPFSRGNESEADSIGTELMARAGYDPKAAVSLWQKMLNHSGNSGFEILSTHPSHENRIKELEKISADLEGIYKKAGK